MSREVGVDMVDLGALAGWMDGRGLGRGRIGGAEAIAGGTQNLLLRFEREGRSYVLRRPPRHLRANSNETMRREARMLAALAGTDVPHPGLIAACPDEAVIGAAFYLMEPVEGFNPTRGLPEPHASDPAMRRRMGLALVEGIAELGAVDHAAKGLGDFGKVEGYLERQVPRWRAQLESYGAFAGWPGPGGIPGVDRVAAWLEAHRPATFEPGIIHGDYHLANVLFRPDSGELAAIVDWELTTIGDPLLDLGWLLATWPEDGPGGGAVGVEPWDGFPTGPELVEHYRPRTRRDLSHVEWYARAGLLQAGDHPGGTQRGACAARRRWRRGARCTPARSAVRAGAPLEV
jgi:aminoglycoside phosphotransferase (APT) family kinase protein